MNKFRSYQLEKDKEEPKMSCLPRILLFVVLMCAEIALYFAIGYFYPDFFRLLEEFFYLLLFITFVIDAYICFS